MTSWARACSTQTSVGFSPPSAGPSGTAGLMGAAEELCWMSKHPNWDDAVGCCVGGVAGMEGGKETDAGGVDGLDAGAEGAGAEAGVVVEYGRCGAAEWEWESMDILVKPVRTGHTKVNKPMMHPLLLALRKFPTL